MYKKLIQYLKHSYFDILFRILKFCLHSNTLSVISMKFNIFENKMQSQNKLSVF